MLNRFALMAMAGMLAFGAAAFAAPTTADASGRVTISGSGVTLSFGHQPGHHYKTRHYKRHHHYRGHRKHRRHFRHARRCHKTFRYVRHWTRHGVISKRVFAGYRCRGRGRY